ncbi:hypothetical protein IMX26_16105 [Clostridium sp. 'deep sea']|uniref:hypothetical protein n=1 Tax=Clostridium sp. 'deep sea' TaxID=2779445 RepID=UPI0018967303|nr:hypothetical protein [Clostridium sp. 'deep sea']QOR34962.1 hypothetical protein IMX26_16105 [Clostridium sp. 'deep sea']
MKTKTIVGITIGVLICLFISAFFVTPLINNVVLNRFSTQIEDIKLPNHTSILNINSICGKLTGNGNGMDFLSCALIKSELSLLELQQFFSNIKFKNAKKSRYSVNVDVVKTNSYKLNSMYLEHGELVFNCIKNESSYDNLYYVVISDSGYPTFFDLRGH